MPESQSAEPNVEPTKEFFVDMLTRDIGLEQAILDLVDNCVDGAKRLAAEGYPFEERRVALEISGDRFSISDNCGGFSRADAIEHAFRFGRKLGTPKTPNSIGQFGVGMKRALFKFGQHFCVMSATSTEEWAVAVDVANWVTAPGWHFPWANFAAASISRTKPGTEIVVDKLRPDVAQRFSTKNFSNLVADLIRSKHRQFISQGLRMSLNGSEITASDLVLSVRDDLKPGYDEFVLAGSSELAPVTVKILVGVGVSTPKEAGWYIVCNGRVVLSADRRTITGWGVLEESSDHVMIPNFHNQYARFRGIVWFDSEDSSRVPWNTTKTDVDIDNVVWEAAFARMLEMMRPVVAFLNDLDRDIDENTRESIPLYNYVSQASSVRAETIREKADFSAPDRRSVKFSPKTVKIQYSRAISDVEFLKDVFSVPSARAVGEKTFDLMLASQRSA